MMFHFSSGRNDFQFHCIDERSKELLRRFFEMSAPVRCGEDVTDTEITSLLKRTHSTPAQLLSLVHWLMRLRALMQQISTHMLAGIIAARPAAQDIMQLVVSVLDACQLKSLHYLAEADDKAVDKTIDKVHDKADHDSKSVDLSGAEEAAPEQELGTSRDQGADSTVVATMQARLSKLQEALAEKEMAQKAKPADG
jgi:hypothetical protein